MTRIVNHTARRMPALALRRRSADHPMAMFVTLAAIALSTMAFSAGSASDFSPTPRFDASVLGKADRKTSRLPITSKPVSACDGIAWGVETPECLREIAIENGRKEARTVRVIAAADIDASRPNIF